MSIWRLVLREIRHRRLNFLLALASVAVAVAGVVAAEVLLASDRQATAEILRQRQREVEQSVQTRQQEVERAGADLQDAMRRTMRELGFNVLIVPQDQDLSELHLNGTLSKTMPEEYVKKLAATSIVTVNHLLPSVTRRIRWPERELDIILYGTRGEVPIMHASEKKPLLEAVPPGTMVVGYQIHQKLGLKSGDTVTLLGENFTVTTLHPERGSTDDVTVWIDLAQAQKLLGMENLIHAILALECECAGDRISQIRAEIQQILPGTQVVERYSQALTRAEARGRAKQAAEQALQQAQAAGAAALQQEADNRAALEQRHRDLAAMLVPLVILSAAVWVGLLAFGNVRQRTVEIGILRAIGLRARQIQAVFLSKAVLIGLLGAIVGCGAGLLAGGLLADAAAGDSVLAASVSSADADTTTASVPRIILTDSLLAVLLSALVLAPVLSVIASWLPAMLAASRDPALVLQAE